MPLAALPVHRWENNLSSLHRASVLQSFQAGFIWIAKAPEARPLAVRKFPISVETEQSCIQDQP